MKTFKIISAIFFFINKLKPSSLFFQHTDYEYTIKITHRPVAYSTDETSLTDSIQ